jgi:DNA replication protein DnaC
MSDEKPPDEKPKIDLAALRERNERLRQQADAAEFERHRAESRELLDAISAAATRQLESFRELPCRGEVARVGMCTEEFASTCERRTTPSCPRSIVAEDARRQSETERERLKLSGVPGDIRRVLSTAFEPTEATQAVDAWLASGKRLLLLAGTFGTGKSVAAGYAIQRRPGRWMHASEIAKAAGFKHEDRMAELQSARLLVIDDLGAEFNDASGWGKAALTTLLLTRYEDGLATVMTTNLDGKAWKQYADPRILDRLAGDGVVFGAVGKSRRR